MVSKKKHPASERNVFTFSEFSTIRVFRLKNSRKRSDNSTTQHSSFDTATPNVINADIPYDRLDLLNKYLTDPYVFKRGHEVEWFSILPEVDAMITLQNRLRKVVNELGIVVEVNPSSNLLIGNLSDLKNHTFWRLDPPDNNHNSPPVAICIGSDDPLTFATDLRREYALIYESLIDGGLSAKEAWEYVDRVRRV